MIESIRMNAKDILIVILPLLSAIIGSYATYFFTRKNKSHENSVKYKEERYKELLVSLQGFVGKTANSETVAAHVI
jgi:flagellar basal body-associated protein FliL